MNLFWPKKSAISYADLANYGTAPSIHYGNSVFVGGGGGGGFSTLAEAKPLPTRKSGEVFLCWRWWRCAMRDGPVLQSTYKDTLWEGPIMRSDAKPTAHTQSGLHGWFRFSAPAVGSDQKDTGGGGLASLLYSYGTETIYYPIAGEVELFGTCIVHEDGVRGEVARIKRLVVYPRHMPFCRPETIRQLADRYDCPTEVGRWYDPKDHKPAQEATP